MRDCLAAIVLAVSVASASAADVAFKDPPAVARSGQKVEISFSVTGPTDVEVAILSPDGKVVRHLAAGVLGGAKNPPPPLAPGLTQRLVWDGKGDWGSAPGDGPFSVRVRLGLSARFGRIIADSPFNFNETFCRGLAVDPDSGELYMLGMKTRDSALIFLRVYDRQGNYLREIMPYPANVDARSRELFGSVTVPETGEQAPLNYHSLWPTFYPFAQNPEGTRDLNVKLVGFRRADKSVVLAHESFASIFRIRGGDGAAAGDKFAEPLWTGRKLAGSAGVGPVMGAIAPDGKAIYFAGYAAPPKKPDKLNAAWPDGRIYKTVLTADGCKSDAFADVALPDDAPAPVKGWNVWADTCALHGLAVAADGRVFVCDNVAGKVHVFAADGKPAGSFDAPFAYCVAANDKGDTLYVLTRDARKYGQCPKSLLKLDCSKAQARVVARLDLTDRGGATDPFLAADLSGKAPQLWVSGCPRSESLLRIADTGQALEIVEDLADRGKTAAGFACRMDVDPEADLVYVHNGWAYILRYNGLSGEYAGQLDKDGRARPIVGSEFAVRRDGMIYLSGSDNAGGGYSGPWRRLTRDLAEAPLPGGAKQFADRYGKMGGGYFGNQGSAVAPDGTLYFNGMFTFRINAIFQLKPDGTPGACPRLRDAFANAAISPACKKAGFDGALVGWLQDQSGGVDVDQQGNIYAGVRILPRDFKMPAEFDKLDRKAFRHWFESLGSVIKFAPTGGGMVPDSLKPGEKYRIDKAWTYEFTVPEKIADGVKMGFGQRLDWYQPPRTITMEGGLAAYPMLAPFSNQCACQTPRFEVDDYGRLFIPNALTCSVQVVDNEGNLITRFGSYGNADSAGPGGRIPGPAIPLAYPVAVRTSLKHIYVADSANRRVVRLDPSYIAEQTVAIK